MEDDIVSNDDFLKAFGIGDEADQQQPNNEGNNTPTDTTPGEDTSNNNANNDANAGNNANANNDANKDGSKPEGNQDGEKSNPNSDKSAQAFAAMRVELTNTKRLLDSVATVLGLDPKAKDSMDQLEHKLTEALAKKQGIPTETLERLNKLERLEEERNAETIRNNAFLGFQKVKNQFGLDDASLQAFANELVADGKNPFNTPLDLVTEYKLRNFDRLLEEAKNQGAQAEIQRASKAANNASTPSSNVGGSNDTTPDKITTVKELNEWFSQQQSGK